MQRSSAESREGVSVFLTGNCTNMHDPDEALGAIAAVCIADAVEALTVEFRKPEDARNQERMGNLIRILD